MILYIFYILLKSVVVTGTNKVLIDDDTIQKKVEQMKIIPEESGKRLFCFVYFVCNFTCILKFFFYFCELKD